MKPRYEPKTLTEKLGYLIEECGEVLGAAGKSMRWGFHGSNPELPEAEREKNVDWLLREISDLEGAVQRIKPELVSLSQRLKKEALLRKGRVAR